MLKEFINVRQIEGESKKRWFEDDFFDLIVWLTKNEKIIGFQLCYDKNINEKTLTWKINSGFTHRRIDTGEYGGLRYKETPVLVKDRFFNKRKIADIFLKESTEIDQKIAKFVYQKIKEYKSIGILNH